MANNLKSSDKYSSSPLDISNLASEARPKALLYNNYFETAGGGERSCLDIGIALDSLGYAVALATASKAEFSLDSLKSSFGLEQSINWPLYRFNSEEELGSFVKKEKYDLFVNHTYCSFMPNCAPIGLYAVMFPCPCSEQQVRSLATYSALCCNSYFTEKYVQQMWGKNLNTVVAPPPISQAHIARPMTKFEEKERLILNVGRFNVFGHNKCQLEAIQAFVRFVDEGTIDQSWKLVVAGNINPTPETEAYLAECKTTAAGKQVEIMTNVEFSVLQSLYQRASMLWQFTGCNLNFGERPQHCEHLGLVAMDCFAYGTIPVIYHRSGMNYFINYGINGFSFGKTEELRDISSLIANNFGKPLHQSLFENSLKSKDKFTFDMFRSNIGRIVSKAKSLSNEAAPKIGAAEAEDCYSTVPVGVDSQLRSIEVARLQTRKIKILVDSCETLGSDKVKLSQQLEAISQLVGAPVDGLLPEIEQLVRWRSLGQSKLGPTPEVAENQASILWSYVAAMGSPGHRAVSFAGKTIGRCWLGRVLRNSVAVLIALRKA